MSDKLILRPAPPKPTEPTPTMEEAVLAALRRFRDEPKVSPLEDVKRRLSEAASELDPDAGWTHSTGGGQPDTSLRDLRRAGRALAREEGPIGPQWVDTNPSKIGHDE